MMAFVPVPAESQQGDLQDKEDRDKSSVQTLSNIVQLKKKVKLYLTFSKIVKINSVLKQNDNWETILKINFEEY